MSARKPRATYCSVSSNSAGVNTGPNGTPVQVAYANVSELAKQMRAVLAGKEKPEALLEHAPDEDSDIL